MSENLSGLRRMCYPEAVAVFGASPNPEKWGFGILHNLIQGKFPGKIYPINQKREEILGVKCYSSLASVPGPVDLVVIVVPPEQLGIAVEDCIKKRPAGVVVITAGFGEVDEDGKRKELEMGRRFQNAGIVGLGPNCQGMMCAHSNLFAQYVWLFPTPGKISILSQSGNVGVSILGRGAWHGIGFSKFFSYGNEAITPISDLLEYLGEDPDSGVIMVYVEGIKDGGKFFRVLSNVCLKKPVVILKGGVTQAGAKAVSSHSGAMAGSMEIFESACEQAGAILVSDLDELFYASVTFAGQPLPRSKKIGIITWGGGWGVLAADECARLGLELPRVPEDLVKSLGEFLAYRWSRNNPIDLAASGGQTALIKVLELVARSPVFDGIIHIGIGLSAFARLVVEGSFYFGRDDQVKLRELFIKGARKIDEILAQKMLELSQELGKPILATSDTASTPSEENIAWQVLKEKNRLIYPTPNHSARAMSYLVRHQEFLARKNKG